MKRDYGVIGCIAECLTCGWKTESYKNGQAIAARHARAHGHRVEGEVTAAFEYDAT